MSESAVIRYVIGNIEVDQNLRCVRRNGQVEHPRARVFDLLLYLIENRGRPITKQELLERVWDSVTVSDSVLYKTVLEVRRLLGTDAEDSPYVKTLPKLGYQFVGPVKIEPYPVPHTSESFPRWKFWIGAAVAVILGAVAWFWTALPFGIPEPPQTELAWWRFREGTGLVLKDSAGRSNGRLHAPPAGGPPPRWAQGRRGLSLSISGGNFVEGSMKLPAWSAITVAAWVRPQETRASDSTIFDCPRISLFLVPDGIFLGRPGGIGALKRLEGAWHHLVAVDEGPLTSVGRIFVDGVEVCSGVLPKFDAHSRIRWRIGQSLSRSAPFRGLIDDLRIYQRPLRKLEIEAIYRCGKEQSDLVSAGGKGYYYLPVFANGAAIAEDGSIVNGGPDVGGIQFAEHGGACDVNSLRGADLGQDLRLGLDVLVTRDGEGHTTEAGPYLRSRRAYPGDGIVGGTSSGYWLKLSTNGQMRLWQLRPYRLIAASQASPRFDAGRFHRIETVVKGAGVRVWLDSSPVDFEQDGRLLQTIDIQETGAGRGTAGVAFSADSNRGALGGQRVRNLVIETLSR